MTGEDDRPGDGDVGLALDAKPGLQPERPSGEGLGELLSAADPARERRTRCTRSWGLERADHVRHRPQPLDVAGPQPNAEPILEGDGELRAGERVQAELGEARLGPDRGSRANISIVLEGAAEVQDRPFDRGVPLGPHACTR